jgi:hypothetical protein
LGALTGAVTGAAIGDKNGEALAGAAIGTAAGALVGAAIGDGIDQDMAQAQTQQQVGRRLAAAVTMSDVISMTRANLSDDVIVSHIRANGVAQRPKVDDLIALRSEGVSDRVIQALQETPLAIAKEVHVASPPAPIVVEEHYYVPRRPYGCYHYPVHHHRHRSGVHWGFSYSH